MKKTSYYLIFIIIIGSFLIAFWVWQKYFKEESPSFLLFSVEKGEIKETIKARGEVIAKKEFDLGFPFSGIVEKIFVKEGQIVNQYNPLSEIGNYKF
jgi:multidrug efflux pump subunit AcrA (membrane-fusion protein)